MHTEKYEIDRQTAKLLESAKKEGRPIIAVGTTVARTLKSASNKSKQLIKLKGEISLFIQEGYDFQFIDGLITNFHVPKLSLLMLVAAFTGKKETFELYEMAKSNNFKLFSFGDGMMVL